MYSRGTTKSGTSAKIDICESSNPNGGLGGLVIDTSLHQPPVSSPHQKHTQFLQLEQRGILLTVDRCSDTRY